MKNGKQELKTLSGDQKKQKEDGPQAERAVAVREDLLLRLPECEGFAIPILIPFSLATISSPSRLTSCSPPGNMSNHSLSFHSSFPEHRSC